MSFDTPSAPLAEGERERLEALLSAPPLAGRALSADALQGMFVAMALGPDDQPPARWLEAALGDGEDAAPVPANDVLVGLRTRFRDDTARRAHDDSLSLLLYSLRRGRPDYTTWC